MHPAYWPAPPSNVVRNLYFVSSGFYVRVAEPSDDVPLPPVKLGSLEAFYWDRAGTQKFSPANADRLHSDVSLLNGRVHWGMWSYQGTPEVTGVRDMEHATTTPGYMGFTVPLSWRPSSSQTANTIKLQLSARAIVGSWSDYGVHFVRRADQAEVAWYGYDSLADPAGYRLWQYHQNAVGLVYGADNGPLAYGTTRFIATSQRVYCGAAGGSTVEDRAKIVGYTGGSNDQALWIQIQGEELIGTTTCNKPVGHVGPDHVVYQQAAIELVENLNPATGYSNGSNEYYISGTTSGGAPIYSPTPYNSFANWQGSSTGRYLWSGRVYRVDIIDTVDSNGQLNTQATRTLIGQCLNEWRQKPYTGKDPQSGEQAYVYEQYYLNGNYNNYRLKLDAQGQKIPLAAQYVPAVKSQVDSNGTRTEIGNSGYVLCAIMQTRKAGVYEKRWPWNGPVAMTEVNANGQSFYIPGGVVEINPSLWLGLSRITNSQTGARWIYSRDSGLTWAYLPGAAPSSVVTGMTAVRKDMAVRTKNIYNEIIAAEATL